MLVLTRKEGERITIGDNILITIVEIQSGGQIRIGIDAPKEIKILRDDVKLLTKKEFKKRSNEDVRS